MVNVQTIREAKALLAELAAKAMDIQTQLGTKTVHDFDAACEFMAWRNSAKWALSHTRNEERDLREWLKTKHEERASRETHDKLKAGWRLAEAVRAYDAARLQQAQGWLDASDAETMDGLTVQARSLYSVVIATLADYDTACGNRGEL
jgi:hypothetical protein